MKEVDRCQYVKDKKMICLEAAFFANKIPKLDFIAIIPNIYDEHSPKERCSISSLKKVN